MNLPRAELVILCACDSGTTEVKIDQGVMSLRRGFRIAGAQNYVVDKGAQRVFACCMNAALSNGTIAAIRTEPREIIRQQIQTWFEWMDRMLDIHRSNFVFREATGPALEEHKAGLKLAIRFNNLINVLLSDPDFKEPDLVSGLKVRAQQLQDAYDTFHDAGLSDEKAAQILRQVFPE